MPVSLSGGLSVTVHWWRRARDEGGEFPITPPRTHTLRRSGSKATGKSFSGGQKIGGPACPGAPADPVDGARDRDGRDDGTAAITHRRRHTRHARLALGHALRPPPPPHFGQCSFGEFRGR